MFVSEASGRLETLTATIVLGALAAEHIKNVLGNIQKIAIFFDNDDYGRRLKDSFTDTAKGLGLEVVATEAYNRDNTDFRAQLINIKAKQPDLIFISGLHSHAGLIIAQAREAGITAQLFSADGVDSLDFLQNRRRCGRRCLCFSTVYI